jgi:hypothetical protein
MMALPICAAATTPLPIRSHTWLLEVAAHAMPTVVMTEACSLIEGVP